jgi:hypothetical protein
VGIFVNGSKQNLLACRRSDPISTVRRRSWRWRPPINLDGNG